jgi:hypothetical protein
MEQEEEKEKKKKRKKRKAEAFKLLFFFLQAKQGKPGLIVTHQILQILFIFLI